VALRAAHESFLAETSRRRRGNVDVETAVAAAKLNDAQTLEDARAWLNSRERLAVLNDRALIAMLARLPNAAAQANAAQCRIVGAVLGAASMAPGAGWGPD
jgi:membrane glycosyltransferase